MVSPIANDPAAPMPEGFTEFRESGQEEFDFNEGKADFVRIFDGPWENRHRFIFNHILPAVSSANGETLYNAPNVYPDYPYARAYAASVKGLLKTSQNDEGFIKHTMARVTVRYSTPRFIDEGGGGGGNADRLYVEETVESETEIYALPARKFTASYNESGSRHPANYGSLDMGAFDDESAITEIPLTEHQKIPYRINRFNYTLKLPYVIFPRWADIDYCLGGLNRAPFITPSGLFAPPGTLRYDGISSITKRAISSGALVWGMDHKFCYYKPGWNTYPTMVSEGALTGRIVHAAIKPPLYHYCYHQLIFAGLSIGLLNQWAEWFNKLPKTTKDRFYLPGNDAPLNQEEIRNNFSGHEFAINIFQ